jgi:hypothetical protein
MCKYFQLKVGDNTNLKLKCNKAVMVCNNTYHVLKFTFINIRWILKI